MIRKNVPLAKYNTFGLNYTANCIITLKTEKEATDLFKGGTPLKKPVLILGSGSNILFTGDFGGTIIRPEMGGIKVEGKDGDNITISVGAGVIWDKLVEWTVENGYYGFENLSFIPGTVGASPVQNIGAYGVEVKDSVEQVRTVCLRDGSIRFFKNVDCEFGYRTSVFKQTEKGLYMVTRVYYKLTRDPLLNLSYGSLRKVVNLLGGETIANVRKAVIETRRTKLPDPDIIGNAGSFFKNPVVSRSFAINLKEEYPDIPVYEEGSGSSKIAAGWLIDVCGWKGKRIGDTGVHEKQALVLLNYGKAKGKEIYNLSEEIKKSVLEKFGIELEREVEIVGAI